jgi:hypothetical protein
VARFATNGAQRQLSGITTLADQVSTVGQSFGLSRSNMQQLHKYNEVGQVFMSMTVGSKVSKLIIIQESYAARELQIFACLLAIKDWATSTADHIPEIESLVKDIKNHIVTNFKLPSNSVAAVSYMLSALFIS